MGRGPSRATMRVVLNFTTTLLSETCAKRALPRLAAFLDPRVKGIPVVAKLAPPSGRSARLASCWSDKSGPPKKGGGGGGKSRDLGRRPRS